MNVMTRARPYNREAALDAALTLFWQKGYHATSLKDLEAALHMKPGSIYAAFSSKENLFSVSLERYFQKSRATFRATVQDAPSPLAALAENLRALGRVKPDDQRPCACMLVKTLLNATAQDAVISRQAAKYINQLEAEMATAFERAKQLGELPKEADSGRLARRYQSNLTALKIEAHRGVDPEELVFSAAEMAQGIENLRISPL